ncbi:hypothetical protein G7Y89_g1978 [Cudoniella acicularis]|uniref:Uncharacterized protein n=1 Tax=Cudoniella acicularis TaxID=354080 RepID=A0A8H4RU65_9HELO|nr:hypothetical protein G7Y89_g1978 [Cudoniella acicularis]
MFVSSRKQIFVSFFVLELSLALLVPGAPNITSTRASLSPNKTTSFPSSITSGPALDDSYAGRCWSSWNNYRSAEESYDRGDQPKGYSYVNNFTTTLTDYTQWEDPATIPLTTLCDGVPRAIRPRNSTVFSKYVITLNGYQSYFPVTSSIRTDIEPDCSVDEDSNDCTRLWSSWEAVSTTLFKAYDWDNLRLNARREPPCDEPISFCPYNSTLCRLNAGDHQTIYYWPVSLSGDICSQNRSTISATPTDDSGAPNTVEYGDITFTSPSVYVIIQTASVDWQQGWRYPAPRQRPNTRVNSCGPIATAVTLTLDPAELTTMQKDGFHHNTPFRTVNWADFNDLAVPLEAYNFQCSRRQIEKYWSHCPQSATISDDYSPYFNIPAELVSEVPEWQSWKCKNAAYAMQPTMIRIEPQMTESLDSDERVHRHKGILTARPTGTPSHNLPWATATATAAATADSNVGDIDESDNLGDAADNNRTDTST